MVLDLIGARVTETVDEWFLSTLPVEDTIQVLVEDGTVTFAFGPEDWTYDPIRNSITFVEFETRPGNRVMIEYDELAGLEI